MGSLYLTKGHCTNRVGSFVLAVAVKRVMSGLVNGHTAVRRGCLSVRLSVWP